MGSTITPEQRRRLEKILAKAEPYPPGSPELEAYDGEYDPLRLAATLAKEVLDEEKSQDNNDE